MNLDDDEDYQPSYVELEPSMPGPQEVPEPEVPVPRQPMEVIAEEEPAVREEEETPQLPLLRQQTVEPEVEVMPETPQVQSQQLLSRQPSMTPLQQAMRRSLDGVDGIPRPPGLERRERSRSPVRDASNVPVPMDGRGLYAHEVEWKLHCLLAKRFNKKKRQLGAGRELNFEKETEERQKGLLVTRSKEWNNWRQFDAVWVIPPHEVEQFKLDHPEVEILPTRWVDTDKAEVGQPEKLKSRLVVRGDLEENKNLRTDSPTASQLFLNLIISFAAACNYRLRAGDISAAFLQGSLIRRLLAMTLPKGGIPDPTVLPGSLLIANKSVYGTRDAPRGFWKALHDTLLAKGLRPVPYETSAYYLPGSAGTVQGLLGCHVDDLLWCGNDAMQQLMLEVQEVYKFGLVESDEMKYCGRSIHQGEHGIKVTCPNVLDRTKPIHIAPERKRNLAEMATPSEISQLRSVVGSLSWLGRVCRPVICFAVSQLQAVQQKAQVRHLVEANKVLSHAMKDRSKGIFYPFSAMKFEDAILVSVNDASHAASYEGLPNGAVAGHRSQSGRILLLASEEFVISSKGKVYPLEWHSNTIKRVCRSTLQAEALSLQLGSEETEHVRQVMFVIKNHDVDVPKHEKYQKAMDHMKCLWLTDCRSLSDHLCNPAMSEVTDKRLAIDLTSLRQEIWRAPGESVGNPTYSDSMPPDGTTLIRWISTKSMVADSLTKMMKSEQMTRLMNTGELEVEYEASTPEKVYGCENSVSTM